MFKLMWTTGKILIQMPQPLTIQQEDLPFVIWTGTKLLQMIFLVGLGLTKEV